jgi:hypothetical protein
MRSKMSIVEILALICLGLTLYFIYNDAFSKSKDEMVMKTETGEVVLTTEPCEFIKMGLTNYPYAAYATEKGHANHEGCWRMDIVDRMSAVLVYFPEIDATAVYNPKLFIPRSEPNVSIDPQFENNRFMIYGVYTF